MVGAYIFRTLQSTKQHAPSATDGSVERSISLPTQQSGPLDALEADKADTRVTDKLRVRPGQACVQAALLFNTPKTSARERQFKAMDKLHAEQDVRRIQDSRRSLDALMDRTKAQH